MRRKVFSCNSAIIVAILLLAEMFHSNIVNSQRGNIFDRWIKSENLFSQRQPVQDSLNEFKVVSNDLNLQTQRNSRSRSGRCNSHHDCGRHHYCSCHNHCHPTHGESCNRNGRGTVFEEERYRSLRSWLDCREVVESTDASCQSKYDCGCGRHCSCHGYCVGHCTYK